MEIETNRKRLLHQQTELRRMLTSSGRFNEAMQLFFDQHASLHTAQVRTPESRKDLLENWSFEDAILDDLSEEQFRRIPENCEHSIVWCIWHLARIEDVAINILVADCPQVFTKAGWQERLGVPFRDCGNEMGDGDLLELSAVIDLQALREYRAAVGRQTQRIAALINESELKENVDPIRIQRVLDEGAILQAARGVTDYWSRRDIAGLLLMPASRHNLIHLGEALQLKQRKR
jgi:hypothetical protein